MPRRKSRSSSYFYAIVALAIVAGLLVGGIVTYAVAGQTTAQEISGLRNEISNLRNVISGLQSENVVYITADNTSLSQVYTKVKDSVVMILGTVTGGQVQGSGFVYDYQGRMVIITNFHVVDGATDITVTFQDGKTYTANVLGTDVYSDLAVLFSTAPDSEFKSIEIASSLTLKVGDPVVALGNPFGLTGSMTVGIVSQLGRTLDESTMGNFSIANIIQTSAAINPGNSGGPLMNYLGQVVGITTALVTNSQGLGFAVPSDTILREVSSLVTTGGYTQHSWLGVSGVDMSYEIAQAMHTDVTYGWLIQTMVSGGPSDRAGLRAGTHDFQTSSGTVTIGGDIIVGIDGVRIVNRDALLSYLEARTSPGQTIQLSIIRNNATMSISLELGARPLP